MPKGDDNRQRERPLVNREQLRAQEYRHEEDYLDSQRAHAYEAQGESLINKVTNFAKTRFGQGMIITGLVAISAMAFTLGYGGSIGAVAIPNEAGAGIVAATTEQGMAVGIKTAVGFLLSLPGMALMAAGGLASVLYHRMQDNKQKAAEQVQQQVQAEEINLAVESELERIAKEQQRDRSFGHEREPEKERSGETQFTRTAPAENNVKQGFEAKEMQRATDRQNPDNQCRTI